MTQDEKTADTGKAAPKPENTGDHLMNWGLIYKNVLRFILELSLKIICDGVLTFDS
uniref:Uncharacterized protein n=1 Tax=Anguilla anguilla TaxID=7936 RepID=A0A0E9WAR5_ANGAN